MRDTWQKAYALVRKEEGGNDDDPADHGGRTSRGITQREYDAWRIEQRLGTRDVWSATEGEIEEIYLGEYWLPFCDDLPVGPDYVFFDISVNAGPHRAALTLQRALKVVADGRVGPVTRQAAKNMDAAALVNKMIEADKEFYRSLHQPRFIRGWLNRAEFVRANALKLVKGEANEHGAAVNS